MKVDCHHSFDHLHRQAGKEALGNSETNRMSFPSLPFDLILGFHSVEQSCQYREQVFVAQYDAQNFSMDNC